MNLATITQAEIRECRSIVAKLYRNNKGEPFILTDGQALIFALIFKKKHPRLHIETYTRYGKSETISMAVLTRVATYPEKFSIVAGKKDKASIIMGYAIGHIFDNAYTSRRFIIDKGESEENIRRYRNKDRINFDLGKGLLGEMFICTGENALGFGAPNVVEDESALISDQDHALIMRMLGDQPDNFLCKVGNPWESDHFRKSFEDEAYKKVIIDYVQGIKEGRLSPAYVDEMRKQAFFDVLYECKFPKSGISDDKGWVPLLTKDEIDRAMITDGWGFGTNKLGVDVAGGGRNFSVIVQRHTNYAKKIHKSDDPDTMNLAEKVLTLKTSDRTIIPQNIFTDSVGIGKGVYDILNREIPGIWAINPGMKPTNGIEEERFINLRAELYWKARAWIIAGGKLERDDDWYQLTKIKYRVKLEGRRGKMQIISKEDLLKEGIQSPDVADAFAMTFRTIDTTPFPMTEEEMEREIKATQASDPYNPLPEI